MKKFLDSFSIDDAYRRIEGLEIGENPAAMEIFCQTAIDYSRHELRRKGLDLLAVAPYGEIRSFCSLWLSIHSGVNSENAFIGLTHAIESNACEHARWRRRASPVV